MGDGRDGSLEEVMTARFISELWLGPVILADECSLYIYPIELALKKCFEGLILIWAFEVWFDGSGFTIVRESWLIVPVYPNRGFSFFKDWSLEWELASGTFKALSLLSLIVLLRESWRKFSLSEFFPLWKVLLNILELAESLSLEPNWFELPVVWAAKVMWVDLMPIPW
jgi:hypothetical protein